MAFAYDVKGRIFKAQKDYQVALLWYKKSEKIYSSLDDKHYETKMFIGMAETYLGLNEDNEALHYANKANETSKNLKYLKGLRDSYHVLYLLHRKKENFKNSLKYYELHQSYLDTLNINESKKSIALVNAQNDYDKKKKQLISNNEKLQTKQNIYVFSSISILLFMLTILFLVRKNSKTYKSFNSILLKQKENLIKSEKGLKNANQAKTKLISIIGHDLKGPILNFQNLLYLYENKSLNGKELQNLLPRFRDSIDSIAFTLENLLFWGRTQLNGFTAHPQNFDIYSIVSNTKKFLSEQFDSKSIKLIIDVKPNTIIHADPNQIEIVLRNLLSNALKFTPKKGKVTLRSIVKDADIQFIIQDNGVGMDKNTAERIFDNDTNHSTYGTEHEKGTGIGLSLCKQIIRINNGEIWLESEINKGTTFYFTLPQAIND